MSTKVDTYPQPRESVGGGAVWGCRTVGAMDGAIEPPWVRALCLRSTASQAPERPAASGWAGPRRGVYGVSCQSTAPRQTTDNPEPRWLWLWLLPASGRHDPGAGRSPADPPPLRTKTISLISANRHPFATPVPYCAAACACGRPVLKIARPSLRSIQDDTAMAGSWGSSNRTYQATRAGATATAWRPPQSHFKLDRFKLSVPRHRINPGERERWE